jgi:hypothetical protein
LDGQDGAELLQLNHDNSVTGVAVTADGARIVTSSIDGARLWDAAVIKDFTELRKSFREHPLMTEIEQLFRPSLPREAAETAELSTPERKCIGGPE